MYGQPSQLPPPPTYAYAPGTPVQQGAPSQGRGGFLGWLGTLIAAGVALFKYAFFIVPYGKTLITLVISFGAYAIFFGPWFAAGLVVMILIHEFGHVIEINRQGLKATAPVFIPFFGAAIFQREHPQSALHQAQIGIAGPLLGTVGAVVAYVLYGSTHFTPLLLAAYLGFFINLFNLIPAGMLDGGWILGAVSKWFQVFGLALLGALVIFGGISPIIIVFVLLGLPTIFARFRNDKDPYYQAVPVPARWAMGAAWLVLAIFLGFASYQAHTQLLSYLG
jgi:Zn-dependent protease